LVNITASRSLKMKETKAIMDAIRGYASEDATVITGTAYDESMGDSLRVTVVVTGLGRVQKRPQLVPSYEHEQERMTGTDNMVVGGGVDYGNLEQPAVVRNHRSQASAQVRALEISGMDRFDIPAFLRKQAD